MSWGLSAIGSNAVTPLASLPTNDTALPQGSAPINSGTTNQMLLLCSTDAGTGTLHDTGPHTNNFTVATAAASITNYGPY